MMMMALSESDVNAQGIGSSFNCPMLDQFTDERAALETIVRFMHEAKKTTSYRKQHDLVTQRLH
jgi:20S proteasome alpha/beta subunit